MTDESLYFVNKKTKIVFEQTKTTPKRQQEKMNETVETFVLDISSKLKKKLLVKLANFEKYNCD